MTGLAKKQSHKGGFFYSPAEKKRVKIVKTRTVVSSFLLGRSRQTSVYATRDFRFVDFSTRNCSYLNNDCVGQELLVLGRVGRNERSRAKMFASSGGGLEANDVPLVLTRLLYNKQSALLILFVGAREGRHI